MHVSIHTREHAYIKNGEHGHGRHVVSDPRNPHNCTHAVHMPYTCLTHLTPPYTPNLHIPHVQMPPIQEATLPKTNTYHYRNSMINGLDTVARIKHTTLVQAPLCDVCSTANPRHEGLCGRRACNVCDGGCNVGEGGV